MNIILLVGFNLFVSSSVPQGAAALDTPSGFSVMIGEKYKVNYDLIASYYTKSDYEVRLYGISLGKEIFLGQKFSILPEIGIAKVTRTREDTSESGLPPIFIVRFAYLFSTESSTFQIGFSLREVFNEEPGFDFLDFGIGFRM
ncbi:hypothetical protein JW879_08910 [candidate division WOR-3 bacterium]|nr:hypothetical protein [candidate division WOR-3 bacterium]